jgi:hypothetical protein
MTKEINSKYPEKLELRHKLNSALIEQLIAFKTYNELRQKLNNQNATEEDFSKLGQCLIDWENKCLTVDKIQVQINHFSNIKFYANRKSNTLEEAN